MDLTAKEAWKIAHTIVTELEKREKQAVVAVVDAHGELLAFLRMDGVKLSSITIALNKAWTAARSQRTTAELGRKLREGVDIAFYGDPRFTGFGGGVPVEKQGIVVGAVAVSGLSQEEDEELALWGISNLGD